MSDELPNGAMLVTSCDTHINIVAGNDDSPSLA
jgi:hypothetical protein